MAPVGHLLVSVPWRCSSHGTGWVLMGHQQSNLDCTRIPRGTESTPIIRFSPSPTLSRHRALTNFAFQCQAARLMCPRICDRSLYLFPAPIFTALLPCFF